MDEANTKLEAALAVLFAVAAAIQAATGATAIGGGWDFSILLGLALLFGIAAAAQAIFGSEWKTLGR